jgi:hypothetical protein
MRVGLWWSFYVEAESEAQLLSDRVTDIESRLGHGLQIRGVEADEQRPGIESLVLTRL